MDLKEQYIEFQFPVLLDMEHPKIYAYSIYSVIAEKFEAIVSLGDANSRYKDFYDIYLIAENYELDGEILKMLSRKPLLIEIRHLLIFLLSNLLL